MSHWTEAVVGVPGGVRLLVEVAAGAKEARFPDGFNQWREGRLGVRVKAPAQEGRANLEVARMVAEFLGKPPGAVRIEAGLADGRKTLVVSGLTRDAAVKRLAEALGP